MAKRILISGYLGFNNFGDEALLHILINNLLQVGFRRQDLTVITNNPDKTRNDYKVNSINRWNQFEIINALLNNEGIIFIGGLFQDKTSFIGLLYYFFQLYLAKIFNKEIVFYGAGIGPFQRSISLNLFNYGISNARSITVRDRTSANLILNKAGIQTTCDPVWSIEPDYTFQNQIPTINWELPIVGVAVRNDRFLNHNHLMDLADKLARVVSGMKDWQILFIPCMPDQDLSITYELYDLVFSKTPAQDRITLVENFSAFPILQQAGILASCDVMISMRYHALLVPLTNGKPVIGLVYDQKIKSLVEFSNQLGLSLKDDINQAWSYFWQNLEYASEMARQASQKASQLDKINIQLLERLLNA